MTAKGKVVQITLPPEVYGTLARVAAQQERDVPGLLRHVAGRIHRLVNKVHDPSLDEAFYSSAEQASSE